MNSFHISMHLSTNANDTRIACLNCMYCIVNSATSQELSFGLNLYHNPREWSDEIESMTPAYISNKDTVEKGGISHPKHQPKANVSCSLQIENIKERKMTLLIYMPMLLLNRKNRAGFEALEEGLWWRGNVFYHSVQVGHGQHTHKKGSVVKGCVQTWG